MSDYIPGLTKMLTKDSEYTLTNILPIDKIDKLEMMKGLQWNYTPNTIPYYDTYNKLKLQDPFIENFSLKQQRTDLMYMINSTQLYKIITSINNLDEQIPTYYKDIKHDLNTYKHYLIDWEYQTQYKMDIEHPGKQINRSFYPIDDFEQFVRNLEHRLKSLRIMDQQVKQKYNSLIKTIKNSIENSNKYIQNISNKWYITDQ